MPYRTEKEKLGSPFLNRRVKLLPCQREMVVYHRDKFGTSQRLLAQLFKVSKRTIQFILDPEKLEENKKRRAERGGSKQYYNKEYHADKMKEHRQYKHKTLTRYENGN